jgi:hypothetical protein
MERGNLHPVHVVPGSGKLFMAVIFQLLKMTLSPGPNVFGDAVFGLIITVILWFGLVSEEQRLFPQDVRPFSQTQATVQLTVPLDCTALKRCSRWTKTRFLSIFLLSFRNLLTAFAIS